jgi:hypothetical protein
VQGGTSRHIRQAHTPSDQLPAQPVPVRQHVLPALNHHCTASTWPCAASTMPSTASTLTLPCAASTLPHTTSTHHCTASTTQSTLYCRYGPHVGLVHVHHVCMYMQAAHAGANLDRVQRPSNCLKGATMQQPKGPATHQLDQERLDAPADFDNIAPAHLIHASQHRNK